MKKIEIELTDLEAKWLHTFIRRSIFEDFIRAVDECGATKEDTENRIYEVESALGKIRNALEEN